MFVTMLIGIYDSNKKELLLSSAGHEPPLILSADGTFSNFSEAGPPLGIMTKTKYPEHTIPFENSSMYIFTDGITEMKNINDVLKSPIVKMSDKTSLVVSLFGHFGSQKPKMKSF